MKFSIPFKKAVVCGEDVVNYFDRKHLSLSSIVTLKNSSYIAFRGTFGSVFGDFKCFENKMFASNFGSDFVVSFLTPKVSFPTVTV